MKVIISLTSIPSRFDKLGPILTGLTFQTCHEIWLCIPRKYNRFPDWDGQIPEHLYNIHPKVVIQRDCEDFGPGTKFIAPALKLLPDDIIIYVDDDTAYDAHLATNFLKWHRHDPTSAWGLSGFTFENYFKGNYPRSHAREVDVLEGYGGVVVRAGWIQEALPDFRELLEVTWHDDMILCNLLEKMGVKRRTIHTPECNLTKMQQYNFGFSDDALHRLAGLGGHPANNKRILEGFKDKKKLYYKYDPSFPARVGER